MKISVDIGVMICIIMISFKKVIPHDIERGELENMVKTQHVDTEKLKMYIKMSGLRIQFICDTLGISRQAFNKKCKGEIAFRAAEIYVICDLCKIPRTEQPKIFCL